MTPAEIILAKHSFESYSAYKKWAKNMSTIENGYSLSNYIDFYYEAEEKLNNPDISVEDQIYYSAMRDLSICGIFGSGSGIGKNVTPVTTSIETQLVKLISGKGISDQPIGAIGCSAYLDLMKQIVSSLMENDYVINGKTHNIRNDISLAWHEKRITEAEYINLLDLCDTDNYKEYLQEIQDTINARNEFNEYKEVYIALGLYDEETKKYGLVKDMDDWNAKIKEVYPIMYEYLNWKETDATWLQKNFVSYKAFEKNIEKYIGEDVSSAAGVYTNNEVIDFFETTTAIETSKIIKKLVAGTKNTATQASNTVYDPIILDLDGDGFNVETKENGTNFDLDKNGFAEKINWTTKDGFLCLDLNGNGSIDNGGEVFGDQTLLADGTKAKNGFEALAQYDSNSDGVIDANDEIYSSLRVWVDGDGDGISAGGELKTLADLGITSINLAYENVNAETGTEATIGNSATFTYADGTVGNAGELWVSSDLFDTVDKIDIEIPDDIKDLPNVGSIGNVYSLHNAMALDETGELKALVESFAAEQDMDKRMETVQKILYFITGANDVADGSRGAYMDAKQLAVIEAMLGEAYVGTTGRNPHSDAAPLLKEAYSDLLNMYYSELAAQTYIKDYVQLLRYTENEDGTKVLNADLVNYILEYQLANGDENAKGILHDVARYVQYLDNGGIKGMAAFVANYAAISVEYAAEVAKAMTNGYVADGVNALNGTGSADFLIGSANGETINAGNGSDTLIGGKGNDTLYGGYENDTYIFNLGDGNDVIQDEVIHSTNSKADKVVFGEGISAEDITISRSGNNMIIKYSENDSVTIVNQYSNEYYRVEKFEFADGTTVSADAYYNTSLEIKGSGEFGDFTSGFGTRNTTLIGSDEADIIYGYGGNDILIGGKGNDKLYGGYENDTYIFNLGDGNDVIQDEVIHSTSSKADKIVFGEGISADDITISRSGNNMIIKYSENDSVTIVNQYSNEYYRVEKFEFADGTTVSADAYYNTSLEIKGSGEFGDFTSGFGTRNTTLIGSDEADIIYGYGGNDILIGGKGNDKLYGGYENDTYIFNLGDGNDVIQDEVIHSTSSKADKIVFGEGISAEDIVFGKSGNNLVIGFTDTDDSITVINQNSSSYYRVENFATSDGYTIDYSKVNQLIQAMASFEADTGMSWTEAIEQGNETANSIVSEMWVKSVS